MAGLFLRNVTSSERTNIRVPFTLLYFAVGSDVSILRAPLIAAMVLYELTEPSQPMMRDDVNDEDRPQHRELRPLLFSSSVWVL